MLKEYISIKELEALATLCTHSVRELKSEDSFVYAIDTFIMYIKNWHKVNKEYNAINKIREAYKLLQNKELTEDDFFVFFEKYLMERENINTDINYYNRSDGENKKEIKLNWNFEKWFEHNNKLIQDLRERIFDKDNEQQLTERNNSK